MIVLFSVVHSVFWLQVHGKKQISSSCLKIRVEEFYFKASTSALSFDEQWDSKRCARNGFTNFGVDTNKLSEAKKVEFCAVAHLES